MRITDPYIFLEKALRCNAENKTIKELKTLLNKGAEITIKTEESSFFRKLKSKQQAMSHLSGLIDIKDHRKQFVINVAVLLIGIVVGAAITIILNVFKCPPA